MIFFVQIIFRFNDEKGFYCPFDPATNETECLGKEKGRSRFYEPMSATEHSYIKDFFRIANKDLHTLLTQYNRHIPKWLTNSLV